jgi:hypothetical protein
LSSGREATSRSAAISRPRSRPPVDKPRHRVLARENAQHDGIVDLRLGADARVDGYSRTAMVGRM